MCKHHYSTLTKHVHEYAYVPNINGNVSMQYAILGDITEILASI